MKRQFYRMIFHGNGDYSVDQYNLLVERLEYGHSVLGGLQQGVGDFDESEFEEGDEEIKDVCRDILASFGYSDEGLLWKKLKY